MKSLRVESSPTGFSFCFCGFYSYWWLSQNYDGFWLVLRSLIRPNKIIFISYQYVDELELLVDQVDVLL